MAHLDRLLLAGLGVSLVLAVGAGWLLLGGAGPAGSVSPDPSFLAAPGASADPEASASGLTGELIVDVEGGVAEPGVQHLPPGSRIADAIVAAGGYAPDADLAAIARTLNLAARLADGAQVYVPVTGQAGSRSTQAPGASAAGGPLNLNQATPEQLDALPGIGPVTVQKIVAARQEQPFTSLDELVSRKVLTTAQLAKIRDQVTV